MIPDISGYVEPLEIQDDFEVLPGKTYKLDLENKRIVGMVDREESVFQFVKKVLSTDKYAHEIYDWYYGNELVKLVGQGYAYAVAEIPRIVREALLVDDRINSVDNFQFQQISLDSMICSFTVNTIYSNINYEMEVQIDGNR